ncbi:MAG: hydroxymethylglutaryl-CoA lyase [Bacteroidetes bacterium]|nr:MAG: hydroxymethylglutaryl-CoA lyase [Bacteroidota bacterium]
MKESNLKSKQIIMKRQSNIKIIETPRDGWQGLKDIIPTDKKADYINLLLQAGFDTVEVGSFVSPRAIPQMVDTATVLEKINHESRQSKIAVLVATEKGGKMATSFPQIDQLFFPFSISPIFLQKNIKQNFFTAERTIDQLQNLCVGSGKELIVYFSMGFGNPYGDEWTMELLLEWITKMKAKGLNIFPLSDITGDASPGQIQTVFTQLITHFPELEFGFHLHALKNEALEKVDAAFKAGIRRFDTVLGGMGGCPMTGKELLGNLDLETFMAYCDAQNIPLNLNRKWIEEAADVVF